MLIQRNILNKRHFYIKSFVCAWLLFSVTLFCSLLADIKVASKYEKVCTFNDSALTLCNVVGLIKDNYNIALEANKFTLVQKVGNDRP